MKTVIQSKFKVRFILFFAVISIFSSCRPDPEPPVTGPESGTLKVSFDLNFNGQPFEFYTPYFHPVNNYRVQVELLKFLMYNFRVKNSSGEEAIIKDAELINFSSNQFSVSYSVTPGSYQGVKFGIGVGDTVINANGPTGFPPTHALSNYVSGDMYWPMISSYIFLKFEGRADTTNNGTGSLDQLFSLHSGHNALYGEVTLYSTPFVITKNTQTDFHINVDVAKFLYNASDTIDLKTENMAHSYNPLTIKFVQLYLDAITAQ